MVGRAQAERANQEQIREHDLRGAQEQLERLERQRNEMHNELLEKARSDPAAGRSEIEAVNAAHKGVAATGILERINAAEKRVKDIADSFTAPGEADFLGIARDREWTVGMYEATRRADLDRAEEALKEAGGVGGKDGSAAAFSLSRLTQAQRRELEAEARAYRKAIEERARRGTDADLHRRARREMRSAREHATSLARIERSRQRVAARFAGDDRLRREARLDAEEGVVDGSRRRELLEADALQRDLEGKGRRTTREERTYAQLKRGERKRRAATEELDRRAEERRERARSEPQRERRAKERADRDARIRRLDEVIEDPNTSDAERAEASDQRYREQVTQQIEEQAEIDRLEAIPEDQREVEEVEELAELKKRMLELLPPECPGCEMPPCTCEVKPKPQPPPPRPEAVRGGAGAKPEGEGIDGIDAAGRYETTGAGIPPPPAAPAPLPPEPQAADSGGSRRSPSPDPTSGKTSRAGVERLPRTSPRPFAPLVYPEGARTETLGAIDEPERRVDVLGPSDPSDWVTRYFVPIRERHEEPPLPPPGYATGDPCYDAVAALVDDQNLELAISTFRRSRTRMNDLYGAVKRTGESASTAWKAVYLALQAAMTAAADRYNPTFRAAAVFVTRLEAYADKRRKFVSPYDEIARTLEEDPNAVIVPEAYGRWVEPNEICKPGAVEEGLRALNHALRFYKDALSTFGAAADLLTHANLAASRSPLELLGTLFPGWLFSEFVSSFVDAGRGVDAAKDRLRRIILDMARSLEAAYRDRAYESGIPTAAEWTVEQAATKAKPYFDQFGYDLSTSSLIADALAGALHGAKRGRPGAILTGAVRQAAGGLLVDNAVLLATSRIRDASAEAGTAMFLLLPLIYLFGRKRNTRRRGRDAEATSPRGGTREVRTGEDAGTRSGGVVFRARRLTRVEARQHLQTRFPRRQGESAAKYSERIDDHMRSIDWSKPVDRVEMRRGEQIDVWVRDGGSVGDYGTTPGTTSGLGIKVDPATGLPAGRHVESFVLQEPIVVMRSTAAEYPAGLYPGVGGPGGGTQYLLPENFLQGARRIP